MNIKKILPVKRQWKVFVLSLVAQFIIASLLHSGIRPPEALKFLSIERLGSEAGLLESPIPSSVDVFEPVRAKLQKSGQRFILKRETTLVPAVSAASGYDLAAGYIVVDFDSGQVLGEKNARQRLPIASLTKIMTVVTALDLADPTEQFTVSPQAAAIEPTRIGVVVGQRMGLDELLNAALLTSANDAVQVIKEGVDQKYGGEVFIQAMNEKANILGLKNTHFDNAQGFDGQVHYSSPEDLVALSRYALENYPSIAEIAKKDYQFLPADQNHKQFDLYNWNGLLGVYPGVVGLKIGNTDDAGYTTVVVSQREGKKVLAVLLGAPGVLERDLWAAGLLDLGFEKLDILPVNVTENQLKQKYSTWKYWN